MVQRVPTKRIRHRYGQKFNYQGRNYTVDQTGVNGVGLNGDNFSLTQGVLVDLGWVDEKLESSEENSKKKFLEKDLTEEDSGVQLNEEGSTDVVQVPVADSGEEVSGEDLGVVESQIIKDEIADESWRMSEEEAAASDDEEDERELEGGPDTVEFIRHELHDGKPNPAHQEVLRDALEIMKQDGVDIQMFENEGGFLGKEREGYEVDEKVLKKGLGIE